MRELTQFESSVVSGAVNAKGVLGVGGSLYGGYVGGAIGAAIGVPIAGIGITFAVSAPTVIWSGVVLSVAFGGACIVGGAVLGAATFGAVGLGVGAVTDKALDVASA